MENADPYDFVAHHVEHVKVHLKRHHPSLWANWLLVLDGQKNFNEVLEHALTAGSVALQGALKRRSHSSTFWKRAQTIPNQVEIELLWCIWATSNLIPKQPLNDSVLDLLLCKCGVNPLPNRHQLQDVYLAELDALVCADLKSCLSQATSVCLCTDGWSDRRRESWLDVAITYINIAWQFVVVHPGLLAVTESCTGDFIELLIRSMLSEWVSENCLIASCTTDGAANERKCAFQLVGAGSDLHCSAHLGQLAIHDVVDTNPFLNLITKSHSLVVVIRGHNLLVTKFKELARAKDGCRNFEALVLDVTTRWDSTLTLLEHTIFFDDEIRQLHSLPEFAQFIRPFIYSLEEFIIIRFMVGCLAYFRLFTKFLEHRNKPTLCYLPSQLDSLIHNLKAVVVETPDDPIVLKTCVLFRKHLIRAVRDRFGWVFNDASLPLEASLLIPGNKLEFTYFTVTEEVKEFLKTNLLKDARSSCLSPDSTPNQKNLLYATVEYALESMFYSPSVLIDSLVVQSSAKLPPEASLLEWWSKQPFPSIVPLIKMLLAIPATSSESERAFRSAGLILDPLRTRLSPQHLNQEFRLRSYLSNHPALVGTTNSRKTAALRLCSLYQDQLTQNKEKTI